MWGSLGTIKAELRNARDLQIKNVYTAFALLPIPQTASHTFEMNSLLSVPIQSSEGCTFGIGLSSIGLEGRVYHKQCIFTPILQHSCGRM